MAYAGEIRNMIAGLDLGEIVHSVLVENTKPMADLNAEQLAKGLNSDDSQISPPYTEMTKLEKRLHKSGLAAVTDHVTLYDTGEHYKELYAQIEGDEVIEYGSHDIKSAKLQKKYGKKIYGLGSESKEVLKDDFTLPAFQKKVEAATGLKYS